MFNLVKMDLYRLLHSKLLWITLVCTVGFSFLVVFVWSKLDGMMISLAQQVDTEITSAMSTIPKDMGNLLINCLHTEIWFFAASIAIAVFVGAEYKNGYMKNIAGLFSNKAVLVFSKLITIALVILFMMVAYCTANFVFGMLFMQCEIQMHAVLPFMQAFFLLFLLLFAFGCVIFLFTTLTRNTTVSIILNVLMTFGIIASIAKNGINMLVKMVLPSSDFDLNTYLLTPRIGEISMNMTQDTVIHALLTACGFILAAVVISAVVMRKRDTA